MPTGLHHPSTFAMEAFIPITSTSPSLSSSNAFAPSLAPLRRPAPPRIPALSSMRVTAPVDVETELNISSLTVLEKPPRLPTPTPDHSRGVPPASDSLVAVRSLVSEGKYDAARSAFEALLDNDSAEQSEILRSWAYMEGVCGDLELARKLFSRALLAADAPAVQAAAWNAQAIVEQRHGRISQARKCFLQGNIADPTHAPLCQSWAIFESKYGTKHRARKLFSTGAELNKRSHRIWIAWANFEAGEDNLARARFLFRTALTNAVDDEDGIVVILSWTKFEAKHKQFPRARALYQEGVTRYGKQCAKLLHGWATLESHARNYDRSRQLFRATLACPGISGALAAPTYQAWALAEKRVGNIGTARNLFAKGAEANPNHVYIWQAWGIMEQRCNNLSDARKYFKKGVEVAPKNAPTWNAWARLEAETGDIDEARRLYKAATDADPRHGKSLQAWAVLEGRQGNFDRARDLFRRAIATDPTCAPAWQAWACMEETAGHVDVARELFQKGVDADPLHIAVWQAWAQMEDRVGEWKSGPACLLPRRNL